MVSHHKPANNEAYTTSYTVCGLDTRRAKVCSANMPPSVLPPKAKARAAAEIAAEAERLFKQIDTNKSETAAKQALRDARPGLEILG